MKKKYILIALLLTSFIGFSQHKFSVNLTDPMNGATLTQGTPFDQKIIITNVGPGTIAPGDSIAYVDPTTPSGQVYIRVGYTKGVNDTIQINKQLNITGGASQTNVNYCVIAFMFSNGGIKPGFDTNGYRSCKTVNIVTTPASIGEVSYSEASPKGTLGIFPNPAIGNLISFDFTTKTTGVLTAQVFDITGRKVMTYNYGQQLDGKTGFNLDISSLNQGLYIIELQQGQLKTSGRLIKE
jgi:hypothetical protein